MKLHLVFLALLLVLPLMAQTKPAGQERSVQLDAGKKGRPLPPGGRMRARQSVEHPEFRIHSLTVRSVKSPVFSDARHRRSAKNWIELELEFAPKGEGWVDRLEIRWTVAVDSGDEAGIYYTQATVPYRNVRCGYRAHVTAYLSPEIFEHYTKYQKARESAVSCHAEILVNGRSLASEEKRGSGRLPDNWIKKDMDESFLLPKSKTPFAVVDYDYYEEEVL